MDIPAMTRRMGLSQHFLFLGSFVVLVSAQQTCPSDELDKCLRLADPFVQEPKFVFPVSQAEIQTMCSAWDKFTDCVRNYVLRCLSEEKRQEFDRAVQESEETMRQMCSDSIYQAEYLQNANCIKSVSTQPQRCGDRYNKLVSEVSDQLNQDSLCCHFAKFRNCVLSMTNVDCGPGASNFAHHMIDKAMGFLLRNCQNSLQVESIDECPSAGSQDGGINPQSNTIGPGFNQAGAGQPTILSPTPTPRPTARWGLGPNEYNNNNVQYPAGLRGDDSGCSNQVPAVTLLITMLITCLWRGL